MHYGIGFLAVTIMAGFGWMQEAEGLLTFADLCFQSHDAYSLCKYSHLPKRSISGLYPYPDSIFRPYNLGFGSSQTLYMLPPDAKQVKSPQKRDYDFVRFGRSDGQKKAAGSYDYIRFGKRSSYDYIRFGKRSLVHGLDMDLDKLPSQ
uniref:Uncharacterized protein n=1 Tax=Acrobeloides nanus TaxID=290746 RepID=A0A914EAE6_9BILA